MKKTTTISKLLCYLISGIVLLFSASLSYGQSMNVLPSEVPAAGVVVLPATASLNEGVTTQLTAIVLPSLAINQNVSWSSSNKAVVTVNSSGLVTGVAEGTAVITVSTEDGRYSATCNVTVADPVMPTPLIKIGFNQNSGSSVENNGSVSATFSKTDPPSWSTNVPVNGATGSVDFGTDDGNYYVESASLINELAGLDSFTVTGWVNNRSLSMGAGGNRIVSWIKNGGNGVDIVYKSDGALQVGINDWPDGSVALSSTDKIPTNSNAPASNWRFFAVTYESSTGSLSFYFGDNTTAANLDKIVIYNQGAVGTDIGKLAVGHFNEESNRTSRLSRMFRGLIDQVEIYGSSLSLPEIQLVQNAGKTIPVTSVSISPTTASVNVGGNTQLTATILPSDATNQNIDWSSIHPEIAAVSQSGLVTGVAEGTTVIMVTTEDGGKTAFCIVTVKVPVTGVIVSPATASINAGTTIQLTATVSPSNATNKNVGWSSSNTAVAMVNSSGLVTGLAEGTANITVISEEGAYTATCNVTVTESMLPTPLIRLGFDENSGSAVSNTGSVSATFSKTDPPSWSTNVPANGGTGSVDFGADDGNYYVESANLIPELGGLESFTVTGWVNNRSLSMGAGGNRIVSWINNSDHGVDIVYKSDGALQVGINDWPDGSIALSSTAKIPTNSSAPASNWRFFAVTYESSTGSLSFYFGDNTTVASLDKTVIYNQGAVGTDIGKLAIGHFNEESNRTSRLSRMFRGLIDQVEIYGSSLSLSEIQLVQNTGEIISVTGVSVSPTTASINPGGNTQLTATVSPSNATNKNVGWRSSNTTVATVNSSGLVTGVAEGTANITVTSDDGSYTATCNVTVTESILPLPLIRLGFNENSGSAVSNTGSVSATFSKTDPPLWSTNVPANGGTGSVDFGADDGYYYVESANLIPELGGLDSFTVTGWVNNRSLSMGAGGNRIVSWIKNGGNGVDIVYKSDGALQVGINDWPDGSIALSSTAKIPANSSVPASNWRFFAVTYESSTGSLSFYFGDNTTAASLDKTVIYNQGAVGTDIGKLAIGHFNEESNRTSRLSRMFRGLIDQVEIYGSSLSLSEIQTVQNTAETIAVTGISVSPATASVNIGGNTQLSATISPSNATIRNVGWGSSNTGVASVSSSGLVTGVAEGTAVIAATSQDGGYTATCNVTVSIPVVPVTGVYISPTTAYINTGATTQLTATVTPSNATNRNVRWGSSNTTVARVSSSGFVTGVAEGTAIITVTTEDRGYTAACNLTVTKLINTYALIVGSVNGAVTLNPVKTSYLHGDTVALTAIPNTGCQFVEWKGDLHGSQNPDTIIMTSNKSITAHFKCDETGIFSHYTEKSPGRDKNGTNSRPIFSIAPNPSMRGIEPVQFFLKTNKRLNAILVVYSSIANIVYKDEFTIQPNSSTEYSKFAVWDYRNRKGRVVAKGTYLAIIKLTHSNGQDAGVYKTKIGIW